MKSSDAGDTAHRKPKIALMSYAMDNRFAKGTALSTHRLIERLVRDEDLDITLVHFDHSDDPLYTQAREILMPRLPKPLNRRFFRTMAFFWKYRRERFDIIQWFQPRLYPFFWLAPADHIIVTAHGGGDITAPGKFPLSRRMFNFVLTHFSERISAVIAVSEFGKREIVEAYRMRPRRVVVLLHYNGGAEEFAPSPRAEARSRLARYGIDAPYILDVSRLNPHKNVNTLLRAYDRLRALYPDRTEKLVIVGGPSYRSEETYALARASRFAPDIKFIAYVSQEDMNDLYAGAEVFVFPSLNEGFGMPVIESFAAGTPVITSNTTSLPEVGSDAAILVDPLDPDAIARSMQAVLSDLQLREQLIRKGLERSRGFTWDRGAAELKALYFRVLRRDGGDI